MSDATLTPTAATPAHDDDALFASVMAGEPETPVEDTAAATETATEGNPPAAAATDAAKPETTPTATPAAPSTPSDGMVPVAVLTEMRAGFQAQIDALTKRLEAPKTAEPVQLPEPEAIEYPDPVIDPKGFREAVERDARATVHRDMVQYSLMNATEQYGVDKINAASEAFMAKVNAGTMDPQTYSSVVNSSDRFGRIVKWHEAEEKRSTALAGFDGDVNKLRESIKAELMADPTFLTSVSAGAKTVTPQTLPSVNSAGAGNVAGSVNGEAVLTDNDDALFGEALAPRRPN